MMLHEALNEMRAELTRLDVEARFDPVWRTLYSTDASNHQIQPLGVAFPRNEEQIAGIAAKASQLRLPLLPRGAGTSLGGQAVGACLVLDTSRYLHRILRIDTETATARVQPGVVCRTLNRAAADHGLQFGPDPASADRATFGGMIGNNAAGAHSIRYGMTADHVVRARLALADGTLIDLEAVGEAEAERRGAGSGLAAGIYRTALDLRRTLEPELAERWPRTWRRASGYGLNYLAGYHPDAPPAWYRAPEPYGSRERIDLPAAFCGSEGTLAILVEAEVRLVPRPRATALMLIPFRSVVEACEATPGLLEAGPSAIELVPDTLLARARDVPAYSRKLGFLSEIPPALLAVEFEAETPTQAAGAFDSIRFDGVRLLETAAQADFWEVRRGGLGLLMSVPGDVKPITFIEDVAVPVGSLAEYVRRVERILSDHGATAAWYAHASAGCLHLRPMVNLKTEAGRLQMRSLAEAIVDVVTELGGAISGEHGDGLAHTEFNRRLFGPALYQGFERFKAAFDPFGILNPGKVVVGEGAPAPALDADLRYPSGYGPALDWAPHFSYRREQGWMRALEACSGVGVCRKDDGVMCPSYQATRDEADTTRARANALRAVLSGALPPQALRGPELRRVLDLCLECKGCKAECPTGVDMARLKSEALAFVQETDGVPFRSRLFGRIAAVQESLAPLAGVHNRVRRRPWFRRAVEAVLGIDRRRTLPPIQTRPFRMELGPLRFSDPGGTDRAVLFVDSFTDRNEPEVGRAAAAVLRAAGTRIGRAVGQVCCGRPMISKGLLAEARRHAERNLAVLAPYAEAGIPIVGLEPSCLLTLRDEYLEFFPDDGRARAVAGQARLLEEFLLEPTADGRRIDRLPLAPAESMVLVHNHCHARSLVGSVPMLEMLRSSGARAGETTAGCCGMAGSFGYEVDHYSLSMQIAGMRLLPEVRSHAGVVLAPGMSCRTQIRDGAGIAAVHPVQYLASRLEVG